MRKPDTSKYSLNERDMITGNGKYVLKVKDMESADKPRSKLASKGPHSLGIAELVAIVLCTGSKKEEVMAMASRILKEYGETALLNEVNPIKMSLALQIPVSKASQMVAAIELGRRFFEKRQGKSVYISSATQAFDYLKDMGLLRKEQLRGIYLNSRYQVVYEEIISVGSLTSNIVHPREVYLPAIEHGAVAVIIAHNHPSGSLEPTLADTETTERLKNAGHMLGIDLLDHLIISDGKYVSINKLS